MTEAELATRLARELGPLATDAEWSTTASAGQAYGSYTDAIDDAMTDCAVSGSLNAASLALQRAVRWSALLACLERLELHYSTLVDSASGQGEGGSTQKLSQVRATITQVRKRLADRAEAQTGRQTRKATGATVRGIGRLDYTLPDGDVPTDEDT